MVYLYWQAGRFGEAVAYGEKALELFPHSSGICEILGCAYGLNGQFPEAVRTLHRAVALAGGDPIYNWALGYVYARQGSLKEAREIAETLDRLEREGRFSSTWLAILHVALGELDRAFELLDAAYEERDCYIAAVKTDPVFAPLRPDPRFGDLVKRMGLDL